MLAKTTIIWVVTLLVVNWYDPKRLFLVLRAFWMFHILKLLLHYMVLKHKSDPHCNWVMLLFVIATNITYSKLTLFTFIFSLMFSYCTISCPCKNRCYSLQFWKEELTLFTMILIHYIFKSKEPCSLILEFYIAS